MKRFILIGGGVDIACSDEITKEDLIDLKGRYLDYIIDTTSGTYFVPEENVWKDIEEAI